MALIISPKIRQKLAKKHGVSKEEVIQCFANWDTSLYAPMIDDREEHATDPPTRWFVAETDMGRMLKVLFVWYEEDGRIYLKSAYEASKAVQAMFFGDNQAASPQKGVMRNEQTNQGD